MKYFVTDCKFRTEEFFQHAVFSKFLGLIFPIQSTQLSYERIIHSNTKRKRQLAIRGSRTNTFKVTGSGEFPTSMRGQGDKLG